MDFAAIFSPGNTLPFRSARPAVTVEHCAILFHGYLSNRKQLCLAESLPDTPATSDAELVARIYCRFGERLQSRIYGEYAIALFDSRQSLILLATDALGVVPLFYAETKHCLVFSTSLSEMVRLTGAGDIDEEYMADLLAGVEPSERTPYQHVKRIRQGHGVIAKIGSLRSFRDYDPSALRPLTLKSAAEYEERCRTLVIEAISASLPEGKAWCELSGGLDSSTIVSVAAGALQAPVETFSIVFSRSQRSDESPWIQAVLDQYPIPSHKIDADLVPPFSKPPDRFYAEPTGAPLIAAYDDARKKLLQDQNVSAVLTGQCGDALFIGDSPEPFYLADEAWKHPARATHDIGTWQRTSSGSRPFGYWFTRYVWEPHMRRLRNNRILPTLPPPPWINAEYAKQRQLIQRNQRRRLFGLSIAGEWFWDRILRGALLVSKAHPAWQEPCSYRNPFLYLPLVEFIAAIPWSEKLQPGQDRALQRNALRGLLPERTRLRQGKRGPAQALLNGLDSADEWIALLTERSALVERGYLNSEMWREAVNLARFGSCSFIPAFLRTCALEAWFRMLNRTPQQEADANSLLQRFGVIGS